MRSLRAQVEIRPNRHYFFRSHRVVQLVITEHLTIKDAFNWPPTTGLRRASGRAVGCTSDTHQPLEQPRDLWNWSLRRRGQLSQARTHYCPHTIKTVSILEPTYEKTQGKHSFRRVARSNTTRKRKQGNSFKEIRWDGKSSFPFSLYNGPRDV